MSRVFVQGLGAVSPAGWGVAALSESALAKTPPPPKEIPRPGWDRPLRVRTVPPPATRPAFLAHPRLRRSSPVSHHAVAAALEALGPDRARMTAGELRVGVVSCVMSGCVNYSRRFYDEVLRDPPTASPLLFPETVFNAPASHLSAFLGTPAINYTLIGDAGTFLLGLDIATHWLGEGRVDRCLVVGAEEMDWLTADAFRHFDRELVCAEGAGALCLTADPIGGAAVELEAVTDGHLLVNGTSLTETLRTVRRQLPPSAAGELLVDGVGGGRLLSRAEQSAWGDWSGSRLSPKTWLGEGLTAAAAWQCVLACDAVLRGRHPAAVVSVAGPNEQAIAARFKNVLSP